MNKANFRDLFKSIGIILLFLIIVGLIFITTNPDKFKSFLFGNKIREGNANINQDCYRCLIIPGPVGTINSVIDISNDITSRTGLDPSNVIPTDVDAYRLYRGTNASYVFYPWQTPNNNPLISNWVNECSSNSLRDIDDNSCCLITDVSHTDFYEQNYLLDTSGSIKYYGLVFKIDLTDTVITTNAISNYKGAQITEISNNIYKFTQEASGNTYINDRFILYTNNLSSPVFQQDSNQNIDKVINCSGEIMNLPGNQAMSWGTCNFNSNNVINTIGNERATQLSSDNQNCWTIGTQFGDISMEYYCDNSYISNLDCSAWLPSPGMTNDINNLINQNGSSGGSSSANPNLSGLLSQEIQSQLQGVTDNLVSQFTNKMNSITSTMGTTEYPNIGNPTYLNIGTCNNNSPYVYNSSCTNSSNTQAGAFQYQYQCYPSLTGEFQECGPPGYQPKPQFN